MINRHKISVDKSNAALTSRYLYSLLLISTLLYTYSQLTGARCLGAFTVHV
jgi:hypothetical protein